MAKRIHSERRKYIRISTVLAVEFFLKDKNRLTPWLQGFTNNISYGGLCIKINDLWWGFGDRISKGKKLNLILHLPFREVEAEAEVVWKEEKKEKKFTSHYLGVQFTHINNKDKNFLFLYALLKKVTPYLGMMLIISFLGLSLFLNFKERQLIEKNQRLVREYQSVLEEREKLAKAIREEKKLFQLFTQREKDLKKRLESLKKKIEEERKKYEENISAEKEEEIARLKERIEKLEKRISSLSEENLYLKRKIEGERESISIFSEKMKKIEEKKTLYFPQIVEGMRKWILSRQDLKSGLILSYEGDRELKEVAFTYDQALAVILLTILKDFKEAEKILDFYLERVKKGEPIFNAYYTDGSVFEYVIHSGVCAWIGIASLNYYQFRKEKKYLPIAYYVAKFLEKMMDEEGGIRGGPNVGWYSTEHNLDAYAFFRLLYRITGKRRFFIQAEKIKSWLNRYAYTHKGIPVRRGKGDSTIATDTFAWSVTSLGAEELLSLDMDPDLILDFAEKNCKVKVNFDNSYRSFVVEGFDFAKAKNIGRGGVVSCEWTSQMILAFLVMADYYKDKDFKKSEYYLRKAKYYFEEMEKMIIVSTSFVGKGYPVLPYASASFADTGHGWHTPKAKNTGSLAATTYFLFTYFGYNPLRAEFLSFSLGEIYAGGNKTYSKTYKD